MSQSPRPSGPGQPPYPGAPLPGPYPPWSPQPPDIRQYAAPKPHATTMVIVAAALALVGVLFASVLLRQPSAQTTPSPAASATTATGGLPFQMPSDPASSGRWEIVDRRWDPTGVSVHIRIYATTGTVTYGFQAFAKGSPDAVAPVPGTEAPELTTGAIDAGQVADGYVFLPLEHAESTLFLTTRMGRAISALPIKP